MKKTLILLTAFAYLGFPLAVAGFRLDLYEFATGFQIIWATVYAAFAALVLGVGVWIWKRKADVELARIGAIAGGLVLIPIVMFAKQAATATSVPSIHNISTDTLNPPVFNKIVSLRTSEHNPLAYNSDKLAGLQKAAYPEVKTLMTSLSQADAHAKALRVVQESGWELVNDDAEAGIIEATETTALWGFKDDVVIRISDQGDQRAVDLRSVSRIGTSDLGANANRIEGFLKAFSAE